MNSAALIQVFGTKRLAIPYRLVTERSLALIGDENARCASAHFRGVRCDQHRALIASGRPTKSGAGAWDQPSEDSDRRHSCRIFRSDGLFAQCRDATEIETPPERMRELNLVPSCA